MIPQSVGGADGQKGRKKSAKRPKTGSQEIHEPDVFAEDEIDPADFLDPEEFGFRRNLDHREA